MAAPDIQFALPKTCVVVVPAASSNTDSAIPRWSLSGVSLPYAVVTPTTTADIIAIIKYATTHKLSIIPASGGHGPFVPVTSSSIYLSMRSFNDVGLDETRAEVRIGGGCLAGEVLKTSAAKGWYTCIPSSNAVGMVGALLGGLNHPLVRRHGLGIDCIKSISIIPFTRPGGGDTRELIVNEESDGEERRLFNALCGAGHGLGVVTSITLKAWQIADLGLTDNKVWTRRLVFPPVALNAAAHTYLSLIPAPPRLNPALVFMRAPPTAPKPGAPMVVLALTFFGPTKDAEHVCATTFDERVAGSTVNTVTAMTDFAKMNDGFEVLNRHGGYKESHSGFLKEIDESSIARAFEAWRNFTEKNMQSRAGSTLLIGSYDSEQVLHNAGIRDDEKFSPARDRRIFVQATPWYKEMVEKEDADAFGKSVLEVLGERDERNGREKRGFANNLLAGQDMREIYSEKQIEELKRLKKLWDQDGVGWSPVTEGWS